MLSRRAFGEDPRGSEEEKDWKKKKMNEEKSVHIKENISDDVGFFKNYYRELKKEVSEDVLKKFVELKTDEERIRFAAGIVYPDKKLVVDWVGKGKCLEEALKLKESGNKAFSKGNDEEALKLYSDSLMKVPYDDGSSSDLAVILANRSACLYHMKEYELAVRDIDRALALQYPKQLRYKILERKSKCWLALKKHEKAVVEFKNTIRALDDCKLPTEKKLKMQTDIQIMLGMLAKSKATSKGDGKREKRDRKKGESDTELCSPSHPIYLSMCNKLDVLEKPELGRHAVAAADVHPGDVLLQEKASCAVLLSEFTRDHCLHCFERAKAPYPCRTCSAVMFCSEECEKAAETSYHKYECPVSSVVYASGASIIVHMSLRIITARPRQFFLDKKSSLSDTRKEFKQYSGSDYESIYHLVRHEGQRKKEDFFERTVMALFLVECLRRGKYFSENGTDALTDEEYFFGSLLLRHLQILQFNAHEIAELEESQGREESRTVFIGGGLFPTLALFNHSCDPGVVRYFNGSTVVARAIKSARKGEIIGENYGPLFTSTKREERRAKLKSQYWFECGCTPCEENWPRFVDMDPNILRFRCDSGSSCNGVILVPQNTDEFMAKCHTCGQYTNLLKGLKALQDTDAMYRQATRNVDSGNIKAALGIYLEILNTLDSVMTPPFRDYHICQEAIRKCMLRLGNTFQSEPSTLT